MKRAAYEGDGERCEVKRKIVDGTKLRDSDGSCPPGVWVRIMPGIYRYESMRVERIRGGWGAFDVLSGELRRFESRGYKRRDDAFAYVEKCMMIAAMAGGAR